MSLHSQITPDNGRFLVFTVQTLPSLSQKAPP